eukprot:SM000270S10379  [mRNA]  locus=s270:124164:128532:- [translate_table: standard]
MLTIMRPSAKGRHVIVPMEDSGLNDARLGELAESLLGLNVHGKLQPGSGTMDMDSRSEQGAGNIGRGPSADPLTVESFVRSMVKLLALEKDAELAASAEAAELVKPETAQRRGRTLLNLKCVDSAPGLFGKTLLVLEPNRGDILPPHKFTPHDVVALKPSKAEASSPALGQGVVYRLKDASITIAMDDIPEEGLDHPIRLEKLANDVTYKRMKDTLAELSRGVRQGPAAELVPTLFGTRLPTFAKLPANVKFFNQQLDHSQQAAVAKALSANDVFLLHGPPGTGKTTAVVEIILQEVSRGHKVLACAASNIAVDNLVERLAVQKVKLVRLGHPARLLPQVLECSLDAQVLRSDNSALANDVRKEMKQLGDKLLKTRDRREKGSLRQDLRRLAKEERKRQQQAVAELIKNSTVVLTTLTGALSHSLHETIFDVVIIDEAAQALEAASWIALLKGRRCVFAGDHLQLPPTVKSAEAERQGLAVTLFERLSASFGDTITSLLTVQYRMNEGIMRWSWEALYGGKLYIEVWGLLIKLEVYLFNLRAQSTHVPELTVGHMKFSCETHSIVAGHKLLDLEGVSQLATCEATLVLVDTAGCDMEETREEEGDSTKNDGEAQVVIAYAERLIDAGVAAASIGIITPYSAQVGCLKELRGSKQALAPVEVSTVDGFQGREKEAIIISMVRSNERGEVGFLAEKRRMNVAVTRARRQCCIVCDSDTVQHDVFLKDTIEYFEANGELLSAMEFVT